MEGHERQAASSSSQPPSAASFYVPYLPGQPSSSRSLIQFAGHLPSHPPATIASAGSGTLKAPDSHLWFWLVKAKHVAAREKFVIWLNGGPGCSSLDGGLLELGPFKVKHSPIDASNSTDVPVLEESDYGWTEYANVLFLDQPAGTGYSYVNVGDDVRELQQAADQVVVFLQNFYKVFPEYSKMDTYIAGESYAGQYIPYIASSILATTTLSTPLKGLLMGNAWVDPVTQYSAYMDFAYEKGLLKKKSKPAKLAEAAWTKCRAELDKTAPPAPSLSPSATAKFSTRPGKRKRELEKRATPIIVDVCEEMLGPILDGGKTKVNGTTVVPVTYNITQLLPSGTEWPLGIGQMTRYLDRPDVIDAFHANRKASRWTQCNNTVTSEMRSPLSAPSFSLLPSLLSPPSTSTLRSRLPLKIFFYAGSQDFICNSLGINRTIDKLSWAGGIGWAGTVDGKPLPVEAGSEEEDEETAREEAEDAAKGVADVSGQEIEDLEGKDTGPQEWHVDGRKVGSWRERSGVGFIEFDHASHMVPIDEPAASLDMLLRFLEINPSHSAGPTSRIPSHIGKEDKGSVLGTLAPNGTLIADPVEEADSVFHSGEGLADDEKVELDQMREAYYGPRRTTTLVLVLLGIALGVWGLMRLRRGKRKGSSVGLGYGRIGRDGMMPMKMEPSGRHGRRKKHRKSGSDTKGRKLAYARRLMDDQGDQAEAADLEVGRRSSTLDEASATDEDPDLAGDIALSPPKQKGRPSLSAGVGQNPGRVLFDHDEAR